MNYYKYIVNPKTGRKVKVNGKIGRNVLKQYFSQYGGSITINIKYDEILNSHQRRIIKMNSHSLNVLNEDNSQARFGSISLIERYPSNYINIEDIEYGTYFIQHNGRNILKFELYENPAEDGEEYIINFLDL